MTSHAPLMTVWSVSAKNRFTAHRVITHRFAYVHHAKMAPADLDSARNFLSDQYNTCISRIAGSCWLTSKSFFINVFNFFGLVLFCFLRYRRLPIHGPLHVNGCLTSTYSYVNTGRHSVTNGQLTASFTCCSMLKFGPNFAVRNKTFLKSSSLLCK